MDVKAVLAYLDYALLVDVRHFKVDVCTAASDCQKWQTLEERELLNLS